MLLHSQDPQGNWLMSTPPLRLFLPPLLWHPPNRKITEQEASSSLMNVGDVGNQGTWKREIHWHGPLGGVGALVFSPKKREIWLFIIILGLPWGYSLVMTESDDARIFRPESLRYTGFTALGILIDRNNKGKKTSTDSEGNKPAEPGFPPVAHSNFPWQRRRNNITL